MQLLEFGSCCGEGQWGDALGVQEVPVDTPVCFGTAAQLKCFACFDQEPNFFFFPKENHGREFVGFGRFGWEPFPLLLPPLLLPLQRAFTTINKYQLCVLQQLQDRSFSFFPPIREENSSKPTYFVVILGEVVAALQIPFSAHWIHL